MPEIETISWKVKTGNRFTKSLNPAMESDDGYVKQTSVRRVGDAEKTLFNVVYGRDYLIEYLGYLVCRPLFSFGKEKILNLIAEAWDSKYPKTEGVGAKIVLKS